MTATAPYPDFDGTQACAEPDVDPETFFAGDHGDQGPRIRQALAICGRCDFRERCAAYALTHEERGIWGGTTGPTRRAIQKKYGIKPHLLELSDSDVRHLALGGMTA